MSGYISLILGPMFSSKTTTMISYVERATIAKLNCVIIKYKEDTRYNTSATIQTHSGILMSSKYTDSGWIQVIESLKLADVVLPENTHMVAIDDGQFYPDLPEFCDKWASSGLQVIVTALDGTYQRKIFGRIGDLLPFCEYITKLQAVCIKCRYNNASFTYRTSGETSVKDIGGSDKYKALCRSCFLTY
jgi:thymidine kinase